MVGDWKFFKSLYIVGRGMLTPQFYEDLPYITYPSLLQILSLLPPLPCHLQPSASTVLSVIMFLLVNGWSHHIWCAILLNDNMDLHMSSLGTLVLVGPWCMFYATRLKVYWGLTHNVGFYWYPDLISRTRKYINTHNTLRGQ